MLDISELAVIDENEAPGYRDGQDLVRIVEEEYRLVQEQIASHDWDGPGKPPYSPTKEEVLRTARFAVTGHTKKAVSENLGISVMTFDKYLGRLWARVKPYRCQSALLAQFDILNNRDPMVQGTRAKVAKDVLIVHNEEWRRAFERTTNHVDARFAGQVNVQQNSVTIQPEMIEKFLEQNPAAAGTITSLFQYLEGQVDAAEGEADAAE